MSAGFLGNSSNVEVTEVLCVSYKALGIITEKKKHLPLNHKNKG